MAARTNELLAVVCALNGRHAPAPTNHRNFEAEKGALMLTARNHAFFGKEFLNIGWTRERLVIAQNFAANGTPIVFLRVLVHVQCTFLPLALPS